VLPADIDQVMALKKCWMIFLVLLV
jgi:hypothetical protein